MARSNVSVTARTVFGVAVALLAWQTSARTQTATPALLLSPNQTVFGRGATLDVMLGLEYAGPTLAMDLHFGVVLPDGDSVVFFENGGNSTGTGRLSDLRSIRPMIGGVAVGGNVSVAVPAFFRYVWQGFEPLGLYRFYFVATRPGALADGRIDGGELLALQTSDIVNRVPATVTVDPAHTTSAVVPIAGGTVTATAADGTTYRLDVPPGALARPTSITLTPVTAMTGVPGQFQGIRAVRAEPEGLTFGVPATLTIHPATAGGSGGLLGFSTASSGAGLDLSPAVRLPNGALLLANVTHFSVLGAGIPANLQELISGSAVSDSAFFASLGAAEGLAASQVVLEQWFDTLVRPLLTAGRSDRAALFTAMSSFSRWNWARALYGALANNEPIGNVVATRATRGKIDINVGLVEAFAGLNAGCVATRSLSAAEDLLRLRAIGEAYYEFQTFADFPSVREPLHSPLLGLDLPTVLANLCVRVRIGTATFPPPVAGVAAPVDVQAGLRFTDGTVAVAPPLQVRVDAISATPSQRVGVTDATGRFTATFTPTSTGATLDILATLIDSQFPYLTDAGLTDTRRLAQVGAVVVSPPQTTILVGQSRQFSAVVEGVTNQTVTWSVSGGGTISATGLFTSNGNAGVFFVTATSQADPSSVGIAQVTVSGATDISVSISTSTSNPTIITGTVDRTGLTETFTRPLAQAADLVALVRSAIGGVASFDSLSVFIDVPLPVAVTIDFSGHSVGRATVVSCVAGAASQPVSVRLGAVVSEGSAFDARSCGGGVDVRVGAFGPETNVRAIAQNGGRVELAAPSTRIVQVECQSGQVALDIPNVGSFTAHNTTSCQASLTGQVFLGISLQNNLNSSFGTLTGTNMRGLNLTLNRGTTMQITSGDLNFPGATAPILIMDRNIGLALSNVAIGNILGGGGALIRSNTGFSNEAATAFLSARVVEGPRTIIGNQP